MGMQRARQRGGRHSWAAGEARQGYGTVGAGDSKQAVGWRWLAVGQHEYGVLTGTLGRADQQAWLVSFTNKRSEKMR